MADMNFDTASLEEVEEFIQILVELPPEAKAAVNSFVSGMCDQKLITSAETATA